MAEVWFYELGRWPLEKALPTLVEKSLGRGWRAVVQAPSPERVEALDLALWTYDEASFLAHGTMRDGDAALQSVVLTCGTENPNGAVIRFLLDGADVLSALATEGADYQRVVVMFQSDDADQRAGTRRQWTDLKKAGHSVAYYQQSEGGRWEKRG